MIGGREPELDSEESCYGTPPMSRAEGSERRIMPGGRDYRVNEPSSATVSATASAMAIRGGPGYLWQHRAVTR